MLRGHRHRTFGARLRRTLVLIGLPVVIVGAMGVFGYWFAVNRADNLARETLRDFQLTADTQHALGETDRLLTSYLSFDNAAALPELNTVAGEIEVLFERLEATSNERELRLARQSHEAWADGWELAGPGLTNPDFVGTPSGEQIVTLFRSQVQLAETHLTELGEVIFVEVDEDVDELELGGRVMLAVIVLTVLVAGLIAFVISYRLHRAISRPLRALEEGARRVGRGDAAHRIDVSGPPELDRVAIAFNEMTQSVENVNERLRYQAFHETVTGFPNRAWLETRVDEARRRHSAGGAEFAVIAIRLEGLDTVVELLGHDAGDELLIRLVERLTTALRPGDRIARPTPNELALVVEDLPEAADATDLARRLVNTASEPLQIGEHDLRVSARAGLALAETEDARTLVRNAEIAATVAERAGRGAVRVFTTEMHRAVEERQRLETELRHAIERDELIVHYQPVVNLTTGRVVAIEALVRMSDPSGGFVPPDRFISLAEATGLIGPLGERVLERACRQLRSWHDDHPGLRHLTVSVNVSPWQLRAADPTEMIAGVLERTGLPAASLTIEVTESAIADQIALRRLRSVKQLGVKIALDDFGTGYSALSVLTEMPIDTLKIDKSFVDHAHRRPDRVVVARAVVRLATSLGMQSVAEGVEVDDQVELLRILGCDHAQGYRFARPLPPEAVEPLLDQRLLEPVPAADADRASRDVVRVTLGPLPATDALGFVRYATTILDQVEAEQQVEVPPDVAALMRRFLGEWAATASPGEIFRWQGESDAAALREILRYWQAIAMVQAERALTTGRRLATPEVAAFYGELVSALLTALATDAEDLELDAVELSRDWPTLEG